jgi:hypothetical protein
MSNIKVATLGTEQQRVVGSEREILLAVVVDGLKQQGGYVPGVSEDYEPLPGKAIQLPPHECSATSFVATVYRQLHAYGTIAGSAALWQMSNYKDNTALKWQPNDVDVFCHSEQLYQACRAIHDSYFILSENERGYVVPLVDGTINVLKPLTDEDWSNPYNILKDFDLTISAVALPQLDVAYLLYPEDTLNGRINFVRVTSTPIKLIERAMKYVNRGYALSAQFWHDAYKATAMLPILHLLDEMNEWRVMESDRFAEFMRAGSAARPREVESDSNSMDDSYYDAEDDWDSSIFLDGGYDDDDWDEDDDDYVGFWDDEDEDEDEDAEDED